MSKKQKLPLYLSPKKKAILERRYTEDGSRNLTGFIVKSVELDMGLSTLVDCVKLDDEYLRGERRYFDALRPPRGLAPFTLSPSTAESLRERKRLP